MKRTGCGFVALAALVVAAAPARAQDASFGCKVLLCAAASAPGWSGIPYCVPVMTSLFDQLANGGSWPDCPEGHASGLGFEPYLPCPTGMTAMANAPNGAQGLVANPNGNLCADTSKPIETCAPANQGGLCQTTYPTVPRKARGEPYYVDITTANGVQRFYFSLQGY